MSWPSLLVILLASWGILRTSSPMISQRPRTVSDNLQTATGEQNIPARLWQDPLALAYELAAVGGAKYEPPSLEAVLGSLELQQKQVLFLTALLPSSNYAEGAEQCRQFRYAVVSALGQAHFAPRRSNAIGYVELRLAAPKETDGELNTSARDAKPLIVPFEWFEREEDSQLIFLHWVDESQLGATPQAKLASLKIAIAETLSRELVAGVPRPLFRHAVLGPVSSTTLKQMQREDPSLSGSNQLPDTKIYSTQSTADSCRPPASGSSTLSGLVHLIGTDGQLADAIVAELFEQRGISKDDTVALIAEWDTDYGRNMFATFREAINASQERRGTNVREIKYLRGLDGQLPGAPPNEGDASTDIASGTSQIDYVRRLVAQLKCSPKPLKAIGVVGSDVYDKLLLLKALRQEFPTALLFTTDLDDRLLNRREFRSTHNLLIASHYNLSLHETLQGGVLPFRSNYQTSLYFGTLVMLNDQGLVVEKDVANVDKDLGEALKALGKAIARAESYRQAKHPVLLFEVGRTGAFNLKQIKSNELHPPGDRQIKFLTGPQVGALTIGVVMTFIFLFFFRGALQDFVLAACRREFGWRHGFALVIGLATISLMWFIRCEHYYNAEGEPFALYEGLSVWPTNCLRFFLAGFCTFSVFRSRDDIHQSYEQVSRAVLGIEPPLQLLKTPPQRVSWKKCFRVWKEDVVDGMKFCVSARGRSWWLANNLSGWNRHTESEAETVVHRSALGEWRRYGRWSQLGMQHFRLLPHLLVFLFFAVLLFRILGNAPSPARGEWSRGVNAVVYTVSSIFILWLIFYVLDSIRLCNRWVERVASGTAHWPDSVLQRAAERFATPDTETFRRILDRLLDVRLVALHTEVVSRLVYAPCVALLIAFIARHEIFDNWSWAPQVSIPFGLSLLITFYCATVLGRSSIQAKQEAVRAVEGIVASLPWQSDERARAEALLKDIQSINGGAMVPLRRNPLVTAALLPFGSLSSVYLLEFFLEQFGS